MTTLKEFTKEDWWELAGAMRFKDGSEPLVARSEEGLTVTVDYQGVQAWVEGYEMDCMFLPCKNKQLSIDLAETIMKKTADMIDREIIVFLRSCI